MAQEQPSEIDDVRCGSISTVLMGIEPCPECPRKPTFSAKTSELHPTSDSFHRRRKRGFCASNRLLAQMAEAALPREVFAGILGLINTLRGPPAAAMSA